MAKPYSVAAYAQLYKSFFEVEDIPYPEWEEFIKRSEVFEYARNAYVSFDYSSKKYSYFIIKGLAVGSRGVIGDFLFHFIRSTNNYMCSTKKYDLEFGHKYQLEEQSFNTVEKTIAIRIGDNVLS